MSYIIFRDVCKGFNGTPVLKSVNFTVEKGDICGFVEETAAERLLFSSLCRVCLFPIREAFTLAEQILPQSTDLWTVLEL